MRPKFSDIMTLLSILLVSGAHVPDLPRLVRAVSQWLHLGDVFDGENEIKKTHADFLRLLKFMKHGQKVDDELDYDGQFESIHRGMAATDTMEPNSAWKSLLRAMRKYESFESNFKLHSPSMGYIYEAVELKALALSLEVSTGIFDRLSRELEERVSILRWCFNVLECEIRTQEKVPTDLRLIYDDEMLEVEDTLKYVEGYLKAPKTPVT